MQCHKNSWIYLTSTYYWWLLRPTITIRFDSKWKKTIRTALVWQEPQAPRWGNWGAYTMMATYHDGHKPWWPQYMTATMYTMTATAMKTWKTNCVLIRNRQIHGTFTFIPSSENMFLAVIVVAIVVIVCGRHGLWPSLSNPKLRISISFLIAQGQQYGQNLVYTLPI